MTAASSTVARPRAVGVGAPDGGQSTVELALGLPFVVLLLLGTIQVGLIARDQVLAVHAAREAVRVAAVDPDPGAARSAAADGSGLRAPRLRVDVGTRGAPGATVTVEVTYRSPTVVPLIGPLLGDVDLHARAAMRVEG